MIIRWGLIGKIVLPLIIIFVAFFIPIKKTNYNNGQRMPIGFVVLDSIFSRPDYRDNEIASWFKKEWQECRTNDDCVAVPGIYCDCGSGGGSISINRKWIDGYLSERTAASLNIACLAVISQAKSCLAEPKCVRGKCKLK